MFLSPGVTRVCTRVQLTADKQAITRLVPFDYQAHTTPEAEQVQRVCC